MRKCFLSAVLAGVVSIFSISAIAQTASNIPFRMDDNYITGLSSPVLLTGANDGTNRKFIVQQGGIIKVVQPGSTTATDFMNIAGRITSGGERGLLGLAFHPNFATNRYFFVNYTRSGDGATVVSRFTANAGGTLGDDTTERILLTISQPFSNHNGGGIAFGPDGHLYIGTGDGGSANDPGSRAQNINDLLGKYLRITPDVSGVNTNPPYTVPSDNPYVGVAGADEIYAIGLRNPWRWSFDTLNGTLWAADVGQGAREEVSNITLGGNFGWRVYEGTQCTGLNSSLCAGGASPINHAAPVFDYSRSGGRCSITGGYVYRGTKGALPYGSYIYGDYCSGEVLLWYNNQQIIMRDTSRSITSFGQDDEGELYVVGQGGTIDRIRRARVSGDFDSDGKTDVAVYRPSNGVWYINNSETGNFNITQFGLAGDIPVTQDYDGDNKADIAVYRPSNGVWYMLSSSTGAFSARQFGLDGDIPVPGDYDGDSLADITLYRPSNGVWYQLLSRTQNSFSAFQFGLSGDVPVSGDYDGDGRYDVALWRPSNGVWYTLGTLSGFTASQFGLSGDLTAQGDYDGDGRLDKALFRPSTGVWYVDKSTGGVEEVVLGQNGDIPAVGDYDGDGKDDKAVFTPTSGMWNMIRTSNGLPHSFSFGIQGDIPIPVRDRP